MTSRLKKIRITVKWYSESSEIIIKTKNVSKLVSITVDLTRYRDV
jgi:hypothetical protein